MNRVIRDYTKIEKDLQEEIYEAYSDGELERSSFPYKGSIVEGVIYQGEEAVYLIPISTVVRGKAGSAKDIEDEEDTDDDIVEELEITIGADGDDEMEEVDLTKDSDDVDEEGEAKVDDDDDDDDDEE